MQGWKECPKCSGKGYQLIPGGWKSCHEDPPEGHVRFGFEVLTKEQAELMVGG